MRKTLHFIRGSMIWLVLLQLIIALPVLTFAGSRGEASEIFPHADISVSGKVTEDGAPIPGVTVIVKGTTIGTSTDANGNYTINVPNNDDILVFSFIGYVTKEVQVNGRTSIDVVMTADLTELQEVVVIGYGEVERRDLANAVSTLSARQLKDVPINSAAQALSGRMAGVQVITSEGSPDADVQIKIRGGMSITGSNSPLYVVDGMQVENALSVLSPQDIESISVLKDASATAIYGSRGANGVVIITTKGGKEGKTTVSFNTFMGVKEIAKKLDVWKPYEFVKYQYERSRGSETTENDFLETYGTYEDIELYQGVPFVDWQDEVFGRSALMQTYNLSINGGTEVTNYNLSLTSNTEEGVMLGSDFDRKIINFKLNQKIGKQVDAGFNVRFNNTIVNGAGTSVGGSSSLNRLRHSVKYRPFIVPGQSIDSYDPDYALETNSNSLSLVNPILLTQQEYKKNQNQTVNFSGYLSYKITDFINFKTTLGADLYADEIRTFNDTITSASKSAGGGQPIAIIDRNNSSTIYNSNILTFSSDGIKSISNDHKISLLLGHEILHLGSKRNYQENKLFPVGITPELAFGSMQLGTPQLTSYTREAEEKLLSFFSRASYSYADKYFLTASIRADGSSKFAPEKRWGYFPAASLMWRLSGEPFMEGLSSSVSNLKLRLSYGELGNNRIDDFLFLSVFRVDAFYSLNNSQELGFTPVALVNENLKWESTISRNFGIDIGLFNDRLTASIDYYHNSSRDLLLDRVVPSTSGYTTQTQNIGETLNKGIEIQLSGSPIQTSSFRWDANFNISFNVMKL